MAEINTAYERYQEAYSTGAPPPWDSGIVPPEVRDLVRWFPPGRVIDVGCGTGTSSVYLAQQGWQVTGVDWIASAIAQAQTRADAVDLETGKVDFLQANVADPHFLPDHPPVQLWLDIGCVNSFGLVERQVYGHHAQRLVEPGGILLLYTWGHTESEALWHGFEPDEVRTLFTPAFMIAHTAFGRDTAEKTVRPSAWYTLKRNPD